MNRVILVGNLGSDPDVKRLKDGQVVAKLSLATTDIFRTANGLVIKDTQWHTVVYWRSLAEIAEKYLRKGGLVYIEGKLRTRSYEDKEGKKKYVTGIVGDRLILLDKRSTSRETDIPETLFDDPLPF